MTPYRYSPFDLDLLRRLTDKVYLKSVHFQFERYPIIYWGNFNDRTRLPGYQRINAPCASCCQAFKAMRIP